MCQSRKWRWNWEILLLSAGMLLVPGVVSAVLMTQDSFDYPDGALVTVSEGVWTTHSGVPGEVQVVAGQVELRVPQTEDVNILIPGQPYAATDPGVLYVGLTVNFSALPAAAGQYFAHFRNNATGFRGQLFALTSGAAVGKYRLAIASAGGTAVATNAVDLDLNVPHRVYLRYELATAQTTLWVNPEYETSPSVVTTNGAPQTITSFALRQDTGMGWLTLDDLRIGTTFADVYDGPNVIPPQITLDPVSTAAAVGGTVQFVAAASGSAPLQLQWWFNQTPIPGATNSSLQLPAVTTNASGSYTLQASNAAGVATSAPAILTVLTPSANGTLALVHYNVKGNFASDWTTNAPQVRAIARQLQYLAPDVITLNEIPNGLRYEMTNWMRAFFPAYQLAISAGTDGSIRSGVISRFPIARSQSWLRNESLADFGFAGTFTRDLFEAELNVPGATESLHVFVTHLKSGADVTSQQRRAAECSAISNFLVSVFLPVNGVRPYLLTGDLNEDVAIPMNQNLQPLQRLLAPAPGLYLTTPLNPFSLSRFTHSIQGTMDARFDYVLPNGLLFSNVVAGQVFRTDLLPPPLPPNLNSNDCYLASDHLPVQMIFNYPDPPLRPVLSVSNTTVTLTWPALRGRQFMVQASTNLTDWVVAAASVPATTSQPTWSASTSSPARFYRVIRLP